MEVYFANQDAAVAPVQPEDPRMGVVRRIAAPSQTTPPSPPAGFRQAMHREPVAFWSPANEKDNSDPLDIPVDEGRWYVVGYSERSSQEQKMISKQSRDFFFKQSRIFHYIDGACLWNRASEKVMKRLPNIDPRSTKEAWLEQFTLGSNRVRFETCWHNHDDDTPAYIRAIQCDCSRPVVNPELSKKRYRNIARMDECHLSFKFPAVPRQNSFE